MMNIPFLTILCRVIPWSITDRTRQASISNWRCSGLVQLAMTSGIRFVKLAGSKNPDRTRTWIWMQMINSRISPSYESQLDRMPPRSKSGTRELAVQFKEECEVWTSANNTERYAWATSGLSNFFGDEKSSVMLRVKAGRGSVIYKDSCNLGVIGNAARAHTGSSRLWIRASEKRPTRTSVCNSLEGGSETSISRYREVKVCRMALVQSRRTLVICKQNSSRFV